MPLVENVNIAPAPRPKLPLKSSSMQSNGGSIADKFSGLKSVHFVGKLDSPPGNAIHKMIIGRNDNHKDINHCNRLFNEYMLIVL